LVCESKEGGVYAGVGTCSSDFYLSHSEAHAMIPFFSTRLSIEEEIAKLRAGGWT
jgi:hypothetical protein